MATSDKPLYKNLTIFSVENKEPVKSKRYKGISTIVNPKTYTIYDLALIKQDIVNHFHIRQGEKLENPTFGTIIWDVLFEPFTPELEEAIIKDVQTIITYDPRVTADSIFVSSYESGIQIEATIEIVPYKIKERLSFKFDQSAGFIN